MRKLILLCFLVTGFSPGGSPAVLANVTQPKEFLWGDSPSDICRASFTIILDSLNSPNTFSFLDKSVGSPNRWIWNFGDGSLSNEQNPVHHYSGSGTYQVCLHIEKTDTTGTICSDSTCYTLDTPKYYDIGGHLFTGYFPINNPVSTGDTGIVYLYRVMSYRLYPVDTLQFTEFGYYTFPQLMEGVYLVKARLTKNSVHYKDYLPTYYTNSLRWNFADYLVLSDSSRYYCNIHMSPVADTLRGSASIHGYVMQANKMQGFQKMSNAEILLYNENIQPVTFSYSNAFGSFNFQNLPFGTYNLLVESAGKYAMMLNITLDQNHPVFDSIILEVFNHATIGISEQVEQGNVQFSLPYPNPAHDVLSLGISTSQPQVIIFDIFDLSGRLIHTLRVPVYQSLDLKIGLNPFHEGLYLLSARSEENGKRFFARRFLKY